MNVSLLITTSHGTRGRIFSDINAPLDHTMACGGLAIEILLPPQLGFSMLVMDMMLFFNLKTAIHQGK